jgi:ectoine hydroxylase-related dioxygenase (phytanoyl-CoA dioxygenase family)
LIEDVLSDAECDLLIDTVLGRSEKTKRAGIRNLMQVEEVRRIAHDQRLMAIAKNELGSDAIPYRATMFVKSGRTSWLVVWHQDTVLPFRDRFDFSDWGPWSIKAGVLFAHAPAWALAQVIALRINLDPSTEENGPLRVIPGTHTLGVMSENDVIEEARRGESVLCLGSKGSVVAMRPLLIHSSSKAKTDLPRRVLHIEYATSMDLPDGIRLATA